MSVLHCCSAGAPSVIRTLATGTAFRLHSESDVRGKVTRVGQGSVTVHYTTAPRHVIIRDEAGEVAREFDAQGGWRGPISGGTLVHEEKEERES